jgi:hypothetical protein
MSIFTDADRAYLNEMHAITTDSKGNEVLIGLSLEETEFYLSYANSRMDGTEQRADQKRYLELHEKHERARLAVLGAENELRNDKPSLH